MSYGKIHVTASLWFQFQVYSQEMRHTDYYGISIAICLFRKNLVCQYVCQNICLPTF